MKKLFKRIAFAFAAFSLMCLLFSSGAVLTVNADTDDFNMADAITDGYVYFYDETDVMTEYDVDELVRTMKLYYEATNFKLGIYMGGVERTKVDARTLAVDGMSYLDMNYYYSEGTVFVYLDCSGISSESCMNLCGEALQYYHVGTDGKPDICSMIMNNVMEKDYGDDTARSQRMKEMGLYTVSQFMMQYDTPSETGEELSLADIDMFFTEESSALEYDEKWLIPEYYESSDYEVSQPQQNPKPPKTEPAYYGKNPDLLHPDYILADSSEEQTLDLREYMGETTYLVDEGGMFSAEQANTIVKAMNDASREIQFNIVIFVASQGRSDELIEKMAWSGSQYIFGTDIYNGTVYLYADFDGYYNAYDFMFSSNEAFLYYTNGDDGSPNRVSDILYIMEDHFPPSGKAPDIPEVVKGFEEYCRALKDFKAKGLVHGIYYTDVRTGEYGYEFFGRIVHSWLKPYFYWWAGLLIGLAAGASIAAGISIHIRNKYKFKAPASASMYTSRNNMIMRDSQDVYLGSHMTKVRIQSSSGGGGGGFHGGGGGHFGGGGGGHHR